MFKSTVFFLNIVLVPALTGREIEKTDYTVDYLFLPEVLSVFATWI